MSHTGLTEVDYQSTGTNSYAQVFTAARQLGLERETMTQLFTRMAFNVAATNNDDHAKNISFLADSHGHWSLAPAYDLTFAFNPTGEWTNQHQMSINGKFRGIGYDDLMTAADRFSVQRAKQSLTNIHTALDSWSEYARQAGIPSKQADTIAKQFHPEVLQ